MDKPRRYLENKWLYGIVFIVLYILSGYTGLSFAIPPNLVSPLWPPAGVALAGILLLGKRYLPNIYLAAFIFNLITAPQVTQQTMISAGIIGFGAMLQVFVAAYLLKQRTGTNYPFYRVNSVLTFTAIAFFSSLINAGMGTLTLYHFGSLNPHAILPTFTTWWLGDAIGVLTITPLLLAIAYDKTALAHHGYVELGVLLMILSITTGLMYGYNLPLAFVLVPVGIWAAVRFNLMVTCLISFFIAGIAMIAAINGYGEFVHADSHGTILFVQGFIFVIFISAFIMYAARREQDKLLADLRRVIAGE